MFEAVRLLYRTVAYCAARHWWFGQLPPYSKRRLYTPSAVLLLCGHLPPMSMRLALGYVWFFRSACVCMCVRCLWGQVCVLPRLDTGQPEGEGCTC